MGCDNIFFFCTPVFFTRKKRYFSGVTEDARSINKIDVIYCAGRQFRTKVKLTATKKRSFFKTIETHDSFLRFDDLDFRGKRINTARVNFLSKSVNDPAATGHQRVIELVFKVSPPLFFLSTRKNRTSAGVWMHRHVSRIFPKTNTDRARDEQVGTIDWRASERWSTPVFKCLTV